MDLGIRNRVALITGASSGLGKACALALAREGCRVAVAARRMELLEDVAAQALRAGASQARAFRVDLGNEGSIDALLRGVRDAFGAVDILVANGGGPKTGTLLQLEAADWDAAYATVLRSMLQLVRGVVPAMRERRWGRVVALTSSSVKQPIPALALSNVFRTGLVAALKTLSIEVAADGVTVNAIATGRVDTDRLRSLYGGDETALARAGKELPIGRIATAQEFAPAVVFLCSEQAGYVTGQTLSIDGGLIAGLFG